MLLNQTRIQNTGLVIYDTCKSKAMSISVKPPRYSKGCSSCNKIPKTLNVSDSVSPLNYGPGDFLNGIIEGHWDFSKISVLLGGQ